MNPIFVAGGIAALVLFLRKNQSPTIQKVVGQDVPSPANPSGLDVAVEPSPVVKDKLEPVEAAQSESPQLVVVNDGNWSPSPVNPRGLEQELDPQKKEKREFEKIRSEIINENPSSDLRFAMNANQLAFLKKLKNSEYSSYRDFAEWVERKRNAADFNQLSMRTRMSSSERLRYILKFLDQKGDLNDSIIEDWVSSRKNLEQKKIANEARKKEAQDKKQPIVQSGSVLKDGFYQKPSSQSDCPSGYRFLSRAGWSGCVSNKRYDQVMTELAPNVTLLPPAQMKRAILFTFAGKFEDESILKLPTNQVIEKIRLRTKDCTNEWCKVVKDSFITDTTSFVNNRFEHRGVVWGTMDENYIAFYPIQITAKNRKRKNNLPYVMFPVTQEEYLKWKEVSEYYAKSKNK